MNNFRDYVDDPRLVLQHLPPPLQMIADYLPSLTRWLINYLVHPIIYHFQNLGRQLTRLTQTPPSEIQAQDLAFPLLSLVLVYLAVTSALRTARYAFNFGVWFLKWGTLIGVVAVAWAWYTGDPASSGQVGYGTGSQARGARGRSTTPSLVDQAWRFVNGEPQLHNYPRTGREEGEFDWTGWVPDWLTARLSGHYLVEVVDGLGAENVRRAAEEWWDQQVNNAPKGKNKGKNSKPANEAKKAKTSRVR